MLDVTAEALVQLGRRSGPAANMRRRQEVAAWRQAAVEMNVSRPSAELGMMAAAWEELAWVLVWELALVEVGTVLLALGLASAWALVEVATA